MRAKDPVEASALSIESQVRKGWDCRCHSGPCLQDITLATEVLSPSTSRGVAHWLEKFAHGICYGEILNSLWGALSILSTKARSSPIKGASAGFGLACDPGEKVSIYFWAAFLEGSMNHNAHPEASTYAKSPKATVSLLFCKLLVSQVQLEPLSPKPLSLTLEPQAEPQAIKTRRSLPYAVPGCSTRSPRKES